MVYTSSLQLLKNLQEALVQKFPNEADTIAFQIVEHFSGFTRTDILVDKPMATGPQFDDQIQQITERVLSNEPIQYVLGKAHFFGRMFEVNPSTLIPRQETEELVQIILQDVEAKKGLLALDIGTGTGCIPITLSLENPNLLVEALDFSREALETAKKNAQALKANVQFFELDVLNNNLSKTYDIIVSNPPYVLESEKELMQPNVLEHEPSTALFVPDELPLLFYERITELALEHLNPNGKIYFEINEQFGDEVLELLTKNVFHQVTLHKDLNGKPRFVSGILLSA